MYKIINTSVTGNKTGPSEDSGQENATCIVPDVQHISSPSAGHTALDPFQSSDSDSSSPEQLSFLELSVNQGRSSPVTKESHDTSDHDSIDPDDSIVDDFLDDESEAESDLWISNDESDIPSAFPVTSRNRRRQRGSRRGRPSQRRNRGTVHANVRQFTRSRTGRGGRTQAGQYVSFIPNGARKIDLEDAGFQQPGDFQPLRQPGPQIQLSGKSPLEIFCLFSTRTYCST